MEVSVSGEIYHFGGPPLSAATVVRSSSDVDVLISTWLFLNHKIALTMKPPNYTIRLLQHRDLGGQLYVLTCIL